MFLTKPYASAEDAEARRQRQEELRRDLDAQMKFKASVKQQEKERTQSYMRQLQADQQAWEEKELQQKTARKLKAQQQAMEISRQIETDSVKRTQDKLARKTAPLPKGKKAPAHEDMIEEPVLSTLGVTIRYIPLTKETRRRDEST